MLNQDIPKKTCLYSNRLFKISGRSIIKKRNTKAVEIAQKSQRSECFNNCQLLQAIMMKASCQLAMFQTPLWPGHPQIIPKGQTKNAVARTAGHARTGNSYSY